MKHSMLVAIMLVLLQPSVLFGEQTFLRLEESMSAVDLALKRAEMETVELEYKKIAYEAQMASLDNAAALGSSIWAIWGPGDPKVIGVCWENPGDAPQGERNWVRDAVLGSWDRESSLSFTGWEPCNHNSQGIRIRIENSGTQAPHVEELGQFLNGLENGMMLRFGFSGWSPNCHFQREYCIRAIAIHEFGHALGFTHEQNRPDAPEFCQDQAQGTTGDLHITLYDPDSVMNYCNEKWNNYGKLSPLDIEAVRFLYGGPN